MNNTIAVIINDIHYSISTLALAEASLRQAISTANTLKVPLIIPGDLHDSKANMRAECVNAMLETIKLCKTNVFIIRGNHDQINEKSQEHALNFLKEHACIIERPMRFLGLELIPYHHDTEVLKSYLKTISIGSTLIMHQGLNGSNSGDYIQDRSALNPEDVKDFRVISGHYHTRQTIKTGKNGLWDFTGNPYTLNFGEANDPEKGFHLLRADGSLEFLPTDLRKHVIINVEYNLLNIQPYTSIYNEDDLIWVNVRGTKEQLINVTRDQIAKHCGLTSSFKLGLIPIDSELETIKNSPNLTPGEMLDAIIDMQNTSDDRKTRLKALWRASVCG